MLPSRHIIISLPLGATVGLLTQSIPAGLLCFFSGILIYVDHLIEYAIHFGVKNLKNLKLKEIYQTCAKMAKREEEGGVKKLYLFLHTGEIAILLWVGFVLFRNIYLLSIALGCTGHLILDAANNELKPWSYFLTLRIKNGFDTTKLTRLR